LVLFCLDSFGGSYVHMNWGLEGTLSSYNGSRTLVGYLELWRHHHEWRGKVNNDKRKENGMSTLTIPQGLEATNNKRKVKYECNSSDL